MISICTDSNSQLTPELAARLGIAVVPLPIRVDGREYLEGVDLDVDDFYAAWDDGRTPRISTSQPSPGHVAEVYRAMITAGATEILSIHIGEELSGTLNSARLAARDLEVPVRLVDTETASFGIACCAWAAADAVAAGATLDEAAAAAQKRSSELGTAFVVGVPELVERSGRLAPIDITMAGEGSPILATINGEIGVHDTVSSLDEAIASMTEYALGHPRSLDAGLHVAVGTSDVSSVPVAQGLVAALTGHPEVAELVEYRVGPSVGAFLGPGTAGLFVF
jgi:fatty acid kinase fatty acid binding subunit